MKNCTTWLLVPALVFAWSGANAQTSSSSSSSSSGPGSSAQSNPNCKTVELRKGESPPTGGMSTSITAGNGQVTGTTTTPSGSIKSGTGAGSFATSMSSDGNSTVVTDSNGNCTVYKKTENSK